ncbi:maeA [Gossypium arboreum]|uniref:MaeA n=1 Tax=Gossypium arboreum TaxID=29729 RepID=A0A0B0PXL7_GOSAR|nr:maeA [Gossypium arboreum]
MLGAGLQFGKVRGEDRFYIPVKARRNQNQKQQQKPKQEAIKEDNEKSNSKSSASLTKSKDLASGNNNNNNKNINPKKTLASSTIPSSEESRVSRSNLERFLESTTPSVPAQYFSKTTVRGWRTCDVEFQPYFVLGDLWESFKEWSAYGAGVPLVLDGNDGVVQYYVPYLSGIQLYGESAKPRLAGEESENDYYRDSSSDGSSDYEIGKGIKFSREQCSRFSLTNEIPFRVRSLSISDENSMLQEGFSSDDCETRNSRDHLLFEFFEQKTPYSREALADKASNRNGQTPFLVYPDDANGIPKISLPVFGMGCYKMKGSIWTQNGVSERQHANSLMQATENWLKLLQVYHPDFQFFASHGMYLG